MNSMFVLDFTFDVYLCLFLFEAKENCPGNLPPKHGKCPEFECYGPLSCSNNGDCNGDNTACDCNVGFTGLDCSFNLEGEKL